jgi:hypothetical protein
MKKSTKPASRNTAGAKSLFKATAKKAPPAEPKMPKAPKAAAPKVDHDVEVFIFAKMNAQFGNIRREVRRGSIITHYKALRKIDIDGILYDDNRDLEICRRATAANPEKPWIVPFTEENLAIYAPNTTPSHGKAKMDRLRSMEVINSDADIIPAMDIADGKVARALNKKAERKPMAEPGDDVIAGLEIERIPRAMPKRQMLPVVHSYESEVALINGAGSHGSRNAGAEEKKPSKSFVMKASAAMNEAEPEHKMLKVVRGAGAALSADGFGSSSSRNSGQKLPSKSTVKPFKPTAGTLKVREEEKPVMKPAASGIKATRKLK